MTSTRIILDCDPGHDDAMALLLAQGSPEIELLAVTTVGGNQTIKKVTNNAARLAALYGITAPVAAGCARPLLYDRGSAGDIHGESGLDGVELPDPVPLDSRHGVDVIIDTIMSHEPGTVTLVPTGPLTNIAMAVRKEPRIVQRVKEVVLMGGSLGQGNWTPSAEFNIWFDAEAAHIVFSEPWKVVMIGLDVTHQARYTPETSQRLESLDAPLVPFLRDLFAFFTKTHQEVFGIDSPPVHDACAVAYCIDPSLIDTVRVPIAIELSGQCVGRTVAAMTKDVPLVEDPSVNTFAGVKLNVARFWDLVLDAIKSLA